jgi:hypothetical protein
VLHGARGKTAPDQGLWVSLSSQGVQ